MSLHYLVKFESLIYVLSYLLFQITNTRERKLKIQILPANNLFAGQFQSTGAVYITTIDFRHAVSCSDPILS